MTPDASSRIPVRPDLPILDPVADLLDRGPLAQVIATQAVTGSREGFVIGLTGPWGSGKTSLFHLIENLLDGRAITIRFNPWWFEANDSLVVRFFTELAAQIDSGETKAALRSYADVLSPIGGIGGAIAKGLTKLLDESIDERRDRVISALKDIDRRIVVFVDDLDRLSPPDAAEVVRLVKLVGGFPNVTYVLAYDATQVARALSLAFGIDDPEFGARYLEKVVQVSHDVPVVSRERLFRALLAGLDATLTEAGLSHRFASDPVFLQVADTGLVHLLRTLRDVERVINVVPAAMELVEDDVAPCDVAVLELVRVSLPALHRALPDVADILTNKASAAPPASEPKARQSLEEWLKLAGRDHVAAHDLVRLLFPNGARHLGMLPIENPEGAFQWRKHRRRVADLDPLHAYLWKGVAGHAVRRSTVMHFVDCLERPEEADLIVASLTPQQVFDLVSRLSEVSCVHGDAQRLGRSVASLVNIADRFPREAQLRQRLADLCQNHLGRSAEQTTLDIALANATSLSGAAMIASLHASGLRRRGAAPESNADESLTASVRRSEELVFERIIAASATEIKAERECRLLLTRLAEGGTRGVEHLRRLADADDDVFVAVLEMATPYYEDGPWFQWEKVASLLGEPRLLARLAEVTSNSDAVIQARHNARRQRTHLAD